VGGLGPDDLALSGFTTTATGDADEPGSPDLWWDTGPPAEGFLEVAMFSLLNAQGGAGTAPDGQVAPQIERNWGRSTLRSPDSLAELCDAAVLAVTDHQRFMRDRRCTVVLEAPDSQPALAYRQLSRMIAAGRTGRIVLVTSAIPDEGKTTTACNLALGAARLGLRVVLVEADLHRPKVLECLRVEAGPFGLADVLRETIDLRSAVRGWPGAALDFLSGGSPVPDPPALMMTATVGRTLRELAARYDLVVLDTPPLLPALDSPLLASHCDGLLFVARYRHVRTQQVDAAMRKVRGSVPILGAVLTMAPSRRSRRWAESASDTPAVEISPRQAADPVPAALSPAVPALPRQIRRSSVHVNRVGGGRPEPVTGPVITDQGVEAAPAGAGR
jgi:capsular exopolysaccharide synthesis family protein